MPRYDIKLYDEDGKLCVQHTGESNYASMHNCGQALIPWLCELLRGEKGPVRVIVFLPEKDKED